MELRLRVLQHVGVQGAVQHWADAGARRIRTPEQSKVFRYALGIQ